MSKFGSELVGKTYRAPSGCYFTVTAIEPYPDNKVSDRYKEILDLPVGVLVAVPYRGTLIPNITVKGGVVRLTGVAVKDETYKRPGEISATLGIKKALAGYRLAAA